jgi:putative spermidine/putrescine transport system permease protein
VSSVVDQQAVAAAQSRTVRLSLPLQLSARWLMALLLLLPFVPLLMWAMSARWFYPALLPQELSGRAWRYLASDTSGVSGGFRDSAEIAVIVTIVASFIGLCSGRALGLYSFRGKRIVEFLILAPVIVPPLAVTTVVLAFRGRYSRHRRVARWTLPIWLYVSVTGVVVYLMLYQLYPVS